MWGEICVMQSVPVYVAVFASFGLGALFGSMISSVLTADRFRN